MLEAVSVHPPPPSSSSPHPPSPPIITNAIIIVTITNTPMEAVPPPAPRSPRVGYTCTWNAPVRIGPRGPHQEASKTAQEASKRSSRRARRCPNHIFSFDFCPRAPGHSAA